MIDRSNSERLRGFCDGWTDWWTDRQTFAIVDFLLRLKTWTWSKTQTLCSMILMLQVIVKRKFWNNMRVLSKCAQMELWGSNVKWWIKNHFPLLVRYSLNRFTWWDIKANQCKRIESIEEDLQTRQAELHIKESSFAIMLEPYFTDVIV